MQEVDQDSEEDSEDDSDEEAPRRQWQGIEAVFEAYQEHIEGKGLCGRVVRASSRSVLDFCQSRSA